MPKKLDMQRLAGFAVGLLIWFFAIIPYFANLSVTHGIILSFSLFLALSYLYFRVVFKTTRMPTKHLALFVWSYIVIDIIQPPKLITMASDTALLTPEQAFASEVYFYNIFTSLGLPHASAWYLTYFGIPILALAILMLHYSGKPLDKIVFGSLVK